MKVNHKTSVLACPLLLLALSVQAQGVGTDPGFDVDRFEDAIREFERQDSLAPAPVSGVVFYGSSSIVGWHPSIQEDLAPLQVIPRGFGGSTMIEAIHFADRAVLPHRPSAIVLYEGDNDIHHFQMSAEQVAKQFEHFVARIRATLPRTKIYFISIKPSPSRWQHWSEMNEANRLIREICNKDGLLEYVDVASQMLNDAGRPEPGIFTSDSLHMNSAGYEVWTRVLRRTFGIER